MKFDNFSTVTRIKQLLIVRVSKVNVFSLVTDVGKALLNISSIHFTFKREKCVDLEKSLVIQNVYCTVWPQNQHQSR